MKRNLLLSVTMMFIFSFALLAAEPAVTKPFNGLNLDGWKFSGGNENCWMVGNLNATETTMEALPLKVTSRQVPGQRVPGTRVLYRQSRNFRTGRAGKEKGCLINLVDANWNQAQPRKGVDIYTEELYGDCAVKLEFLITQKSNSGVYLMGEYEVQIADSFGKPNDKLGQGDMGAIYSAAPPSTNATGAPGTWQTFEIEFVAPKFNADGNKTANALFKKIVLNGKIVQENVEAEKPTGGGLTMKEAPIGPLMLQGNHGPIAFRNIEIMCNK